MNDIELLIEEHGELRREAAALEALLGPQRGVGWEDNSNCDVTRFRAAQEGLLRNLAAHELKEESVIGRHLRAPGGLEIRAEVERAHETLNRLVTLLRSVATLCTGGRVHALRTITARVREELESHLVYEEKMLFPLLLGHAPSLRPLRRPSARAPRG